MYQLNCARCRKVSLGGRNITSRDGGKVLQDRRKVPESRGHRKRKTRKVTQDGHNVSKGVARCRGDARHRETVARHRKTVAKGASPLWNPSQDSHKTIARCRKVSQDGHDVSQGVGRCRGDARPSQGVARCRGDARRSQGDARRSQGVASAARRPSASQDIARHRKASQGVARRSQEVAIRWQGVARRTQDERKTNARRSQCVAIQYIIGWMTNAFSHTNILYNLYESSLGHGVSEGTSATHGLVV